MMRIAKITPPSPSGIVLRKRLFHLLDSHKERPVIWIAGPAGSGKTILISSYLKTSKCPILWYQMDTGDADIATFFYYLALAVRKAVPRRKISLPLLTPECRLDTAAFARRFFEQLFSYIPMNCTLVFDNYQEVPPESLLCKILSEVLSLIPANIRVILISRQMPPQDLIRLRVNNLLAIVTWEDIRLDLKESIEIIRLRKMKSLSRKAVERLYDIVDGWAAGLVMILERMKTQSLDLGTMQRHPPEEIFDYFTSEVFDQFAPELQFFLLKTAFLPKMTTDMALAMTGMNDARRILTNLSKTSYFTVEHGHRSPHYSYHPLFQRFLITRARQTFSPEALKNVQNQAILNLEAMGQTEAAVELLQEIKAWDALISLIQKHASSMVSQGRDHTLKEWLLSLPPDLVDQQGWLLYWMGICLLSTDLKRSRQRFEEAFEWFEARTDEIGQLSAWTGIVDAILSEADDFRQLDRWIAWLDSHTMPPVRLPNPELEAAVITSMFGALTYRQPGHPKVDQWLHEAERIMSGGPNWYFRIRTGNYVGYYYFWVHKAVLILNIFKYLGKETSSLEHYPVSYIFYKYNDSSVYAFYDLSRELCQKVAQEGLDFAQATGIHLFDFLLYGAIVIGSLIDGGIREAEKYLDAMIPSLVGKFGQGMHHYLASWVSCLKANLPMALAQAEQALNINVSLGMPFAEGIVRHAVAELLFESGKRKEAYDQLFILRRIAEDTRSNNLTFFHHLAEARFALADGTDSSSDTHAVDLLRKAMELGRIQGFMNIMFWVPSWMTKLCLKALEEGIEVEYIQRLVRKRQLFPESPPYHCEHWPWEIRVYALGRFEITREGNVIHFPVKAPRRVLLLLKALIACGPKGINEEDLATLLWPDADGDMALKSLEVALHRLRQLLGNHETILLRDGRLSINSQLCWVDAHAFEELLRQAEEQIRFAKDGSLVKATGFGEEYRLIETAVGLYQGVFLEDVPDPWALSYRERLRNKFLRAVSRLGEHFEERGSFESAMVLYEQGLDADELAEQFYCGLMRCHQARGRGTEALALYRQFKSILKNKLNISPSLETEALRKAIEGGH